MTNDSERTACCGLYCGDCIPAADSLFESAGRLRQLLAETQFEEYARHRSVMNKAFESYRVFQEVLDAILTLRGPPYPGLSGG